MCSARQAAPKAAPKPKAVPLAPRKPMDMEAEKSAAATPAEKAVVAEDPAARSPFGFGSQRGVIP